jgi:hypothetical protein
MDGRDDRNQRQGVHEHTRREHGDWSPPAENDDIMRGVFRTMRSRDYDVVVVRRTINLGTGNLGWGGNGEGLRKGRSVYE